MRLDGIGRHAVLALVIFALAVAPIARVTVAQEEQSSNLQVNANGGQAEISSHIEAAGVQKEFSAHMQTSGGVSLEVQFQAENSNASTELELEATLLKLVEFTDSSGTLSANSTVVQTLDLSQLTYSPINSSHVTVGGVQGYVLSTKGVQGNFSFQVFAYAFPNSVSVNSTSISPSALKILLHIENFPYLKPTSLLALQVKVDSDRSIDVSAADSENAVKSANDSQGEQAVFSWNGPLTVDGKSATVKVSTTSVGDEEKLLNLVYPHGMAIVHDPTLGVFLIGGAFYMQTSFLLGVVAVVLVALLLVFVVVRRRGKVPSTAPPS